MREFSEIGRTGISELVDEAYQAYASLYLDCVDDNLRHFFWRDKDIQPVKEMKKVESEENIAHAYWNAAVRIAKYVLDGGYFASFAQFYDTYPTMKRFDKLLQRFVA